MEIYLTSNLFIKDNQYYYEDEGESVSKGSETKIVKLNRQNWHKYMIEYEYEKLSLGWKKRLKSKLSKNSLWGIKDCGGEGDCLFLCIEEAMRDFQKMEDESYSVENLRKIAAAEITDVNFNIILETYKAEAECDEFDGMWDPYTIRNKEELKEVIETCGNTFWGDHIIIQLLSQALNINFIILNDENELALQEFRLQRVGIDFQQDRKTIILSYYSNVHYQLIGYFNGAYMQTLFNFDDLPSEIMDIYYQDCG